VDVDRGVKSIANAPMVDDVLLLVSGASGAGWHADRWRISVIDGSNMTRPEANQAVLQWVDDAIGGRAPMFTRPWKP
jgi:hypothetical protein